MSEDCHDSNNEAAFQRKWRREPGEIVSNIADESEKLEELTKEKAVNQLVVLAAQERCTGLNVLGRSGDRIITASETLVAELFDAGGRFARQEDEQNLATDPVNTLLVTALKRCTPEQLVTLTKNLAERCDYGKIARESIIREMEGWDWEEMWKNGAIDTLSTMVMAITRLKEGW